MANGTIAFDTLTTSDSVNTGTEKSIDTSFILNGVNKICGTIFDSTLFSHKAFFNEKKSRLEMHLVSIKQQVVDILNTKIYFREGENIHTENSYKYTLSSFQNLAELSNFQIIDVLKDKRSFFGVFILKVKSI